MKINRESLTRLSIDYLKVLSDLSKAKEEGCDPNIYLKILFHYNRLREMAKEIEVFLEENAKKS